MITRRKFLLAGAALPVLVACRNKTSTDVATATTATTAATAATAATATTLAATPSCTDGDEATPALTEGPYFKTGSPEKTDLAADVSKGTRLAISGAVLTTACKAVAKAKIEVWQANADGEYDNSGYTLRGHFFTDSQGRYTFITVVPGIYPGRTRHVHVMAQAPNGPVLTSQLFFPGDGAANASDSIYRKECLLQQYSHAAGGDTATFNFVI
jgi:protocatechuate 3,4-dioxygenase beta subunit